MNDLSGVTYRVGSIGIPSTLSVADQFTQALQWTLVAICYAAICARFGVRAWRSTWKFWISDILLVFAVLFFTVVAIGDIVMAAEEDAATEDYSNPGYAKVRIPSTVRRNVASKHV